MANDSSLELIGFTHCQVEALGCTMCFLLVCVPGAQKEQASSHTENVGHTPPHVTLRLDLAKFSFGECALSLEKSGAEHVPLYSRSKCQSGRVFARGDHQLVFPRSSLWFWRRLGIRCCPLFCLGSRARPHNPSASDSQFLCRL